MTAQRWLPLAATLLTAACNGGDGDSTADSDPISDSDTDTGPYECSELETEPGKADACRAYFEFTCKWNRCADPELDVAQCVEDKVSASCVDDDRTGWCAIEECIASVPADQECPADAASNPLWYLQDPSCTWVLNPEN
jgi:hypothetical protein